jgi:hypothetical protein
MHEIQDIPRQELARLLPDDLPTRQRAVAVLDGTLAGRAWADDGVEPTWLVIVEDADGTLYGGGAPTREAITAVFAAAKTRSGDLIVGLRGDDDPIRPLLPPDPYYRGRAIDFTERVRPPDEGDLLAAPAPDGLSFVPLDAAILPLTEWADDTIHAFGSPEAWDRLGVGTCLVDARGRVIAQGMAAPRTRDRMEMGVWTHDEHRRRGLGTLVSIRAAVAAEATGTSVWWNTNADNAGSIAIARRIGFRRERVYELVAYRAS